jgi:hypothetical protein
MHQKTNITLYVAQQAGLDTSEKNIRKLISIWWQNNRKKEKGGLKLTDEGFANLTRYFKPHRVRFDCEIDYTNQLILRLDNFITCPWYLTNREIYVFNDKMAVQLVLFSGNIAKFSTAKAKSLDKDAK